MPAVAAQSATAEPETPPNSMEVTTSTCASPARMRPTIKLARSMMRSTRLQALASVPVSTKKGMAINGKESMPPNMRVITSVKGRRSSSISGKKVATPIEKAIGTPTINRMKKAEISMTSKIFTSLIDQRLFCCRHGLTPVPDSPTEPQRLVKHQYSANRDSDVNKAHRKLKRGRLLFHVQHRPL